MPRPIKVEESAVQRAVALFMHEPIAEAIVALNAANAVVVERVKLENYVPANAAQDAPVATRPRPAASKRGRPPAVKAATSGGTGTGPAPAAAAGGTPVTPPPPATPPGDDAGAPETPPVITDATGEPGSLELPAIGPAPPPDPPVAPAGGRAQTA